MMLYAMAIARWAVIAVSVGLLVALIGSHEPVKAQESCWMQVEGQMADPCQNPNFPINLDVRSCPNMPPELQRIIDEAKARGDEVQYFCGRTK